MRNYARHQQHLRRLREGKEIGVYDTPCPYCTREGIEQKLKNKAMKTSLESMNFDYKPDQDEKFVCKTCGKSYTMLGDHLHQHYQDHLLKSKEEPKKPSKPRKNAYKSFGSKVIEKMIRNGSLGMDYEKFIKLYQENVGTRGNYNRFETMKAPPTKEEMALLKRYLTDKTPLKDWTKEVNLRPGDVYHKALKISLRLVFQNMDQLLKD